MHKIRVIEVVETDLNGLYYIVNIYPDNSTDEILIDSDMLHIKDRLKDSWDVKRYVDSILVSILCPENWEKIVNLRTSGVSVLTKGKLIRFFQIKYIYIRKNKKKKDFQTKK